MVTNQASLKRNGVQDFISLRTTALIIFAYTLYMLWFFLSTEAVTYDIWREFFAGLGTKVFTLAALVSIMIHVRIGLWQVLTDYVKPHGMRAAIQFLLNLLAFVYVAVGLFVLWGV
ncbi:succinate dehydrogenase, hydrophobic membrane anchor protein [Bowmanella sp. JS7-9]|jgi:succinate dehydrogenase / fumarate reductase membrane anchor subunit|uniref:Succinate dehydrogenase hydrophobic membrane anchor subunit n=1 Tax=Pseudobowmanella zhangzhouensis TaxID=1537679 RepID=A0ABW1XI22_9ALTE|nr:succinate dehydrogenase, hydrophobic membrane anchor protein [Bowmanella sp. JS7-9]TBX27350.1 succinate dehydrogenase [Bowmanella sp. JS7-9]